MMRCLLTVAVCCLMLAEGKYSQAAGVITLDDVRRNAGVEPAEDTVGEWHFSPVYMLEGNARNAPGFNAYTTAESPGPMAPAETPGPAVYGEESTGSIPRLLRSQDLPSGPFSLELLILDHVNKPVGALMGFVDERAPESGGWCVAYHGGRFFFAVTTSEQQDELPGMSMVTLDRAPPWNKWWYHVAAVYDGEAMRLYVNGRERAREEGLQGDLAFPDGAHFGAYAYMENEPYMQLGNLLKEARLYGRALSEEEIGARFEAMTARTSEGILFEDMPHFTAGPVLQYVTRNGASVLWETSEPARATVYYGDAVPLDNELEVDAYERLQEVRIAGLEPGAHFYRVVAELESGEILDSGMLTFRTAAGPEEAWSFSVLGDTESRPHINDRLAKWIWGERPDFVINVGDLTDSGQEPRRFEWTHEYLSAMTQLASRIPIFPVAGNGESDLHWYRHYHALPGNEGYYTFTYGNAQFFMLDSNQPMGPGSEQYEWMARVLPASTAQWKFAAHHHPAYTSDENDYGNTWEGSSEWGDLNVRGMVPLYEQHGVDIVFFGHLHTYERSWPVKDGTIEKDGGVVYVQTGGGGGHIEDAAPNRTWFMNKFHRGHHYCMVTMHQGDLEFRMYDVEGRLRDQFTLSKEAK